MFFNPKYITVSRAKLYSMFMIIICLLLFKFAYPCTFPVVTNTVSGVVESTALDCCVIPSGYVRLTDDYGVKLNDNSGECLWCPI